MKMRVGEIRMDQNEIHFSNGSISDRPSEEISRTDRYADSPSKSQKEKVQVWGLPLPKLSEKTFSRTGAFFTVVALLSLLTTIGGLVLFFAITFPFFLLLFPGQLMIGSSVLAIIAFAARKQLAEQKNTVRSDKQYERGNRLIEYLKGKSKPKTLETIGSEMQWRDIAVADGLKYLLDTGLVVEDLDLETGQWKYEISPKAKGDDIRHLPLDERLKELEKATNTQKSLPGK